MPSIRIDNRIEPSDGRSCHLNGTEALVKTAQYYREPTRGIYTVAIVYEQLQRVMGCKVMGAFGGGVVSSKMIKLLGLASKPNTDDMRELRSTTISQTPVDTAAKVRANYPATQTESIYQYSWPGELNVWCCSSVYFFRSIFDQEGL